MSDVPGRQPLPTGALAWVRAARLGPVRHLVTYGVHDATALFDAVARDLTLPAWFGRNWDALLDCLRDLPEGTAVVWAGSADVPPDVRATALDVLTDAGLAVFLA